MMDINQNGDQAAFDINALHLNARELEALRRSGMNNFKSILLSSPCELSQVTKLSRSECENIMILASHKMLKSKFISSFELNNTETIRLTSGCAVLDRLLGGGFSLGGITEISGESASGKTQMCLQLSALVQLPLYNGGLNGSVAYICTEDAFPSKRLHQILQELKKQHSALANLNLSDNIYVTQIGDVDSLQTCIQKTLPQLVKCRNIKLIVVDSIAAIFRSDYNVDQNIQRSRDIQNIGYSLHQLATQHKILVVCVNQVTDVFDKNTHFSNKKHVPALGLTWSNLVTTRIMFTRTNKRTESYRRGNIIIKLAVPAVVFSFVIEHSPSLCTNIQAPFIVTPCGIFGLYS